MHEDLERVISGEEPDRDGSGPLTMKDRVEIATVAFVFEIVSNPDKFIENDWSSRNGPIKLIARRVQKMGMKERAQFFETMYNSLNDAQRAEYRRCTGGTK